MSLQTEYKKRTNGQGHFFDADTIGFFNSRIGRAKEKNGIWYFVTSEKPPHEKRQYTVRKMLLDGSIENIGGFCSMSSYKANTLFNGMVN